MQYDVIIIGGGAAGCFAAITAAKQGRKVAIFERNGRLGKKLLITGKGRCNITNNCTQEELLQNIPCNPRFLYSAFSQFSPQDVMNFFEDVGVPLKTERGNRVFPKSDNAKDIVVALEKVVKGCGVQLVSKQVTALILEDNICKGVKCDEEEFFAESVLVSTGGKSYSVTGSTGDGYTFAMWAGHTVTPLKASLVPIVAEEKYCSDMMGLSLKNITLNLYDKSKKIYSEMGEMLFTHFGISGPLVLSASSHIRNMEQNRYKIFIDLKPALGEEKLDLRIQRDFMDNINKTFINSLGKLLPNKMIAVVAKLSGIPFELKVNSITREQRKTLVQLLKAFPVTVKGFRPIDEAIITSGGILVKEINPKTMESKFVKGLFFAGEVIDVDGYTGGFNLQIAFSTGYCAGLNM